MSGFPWIYKLKVVKEVEPGWFRLRWRPIKHGTYNVYAYKTYPRGTRKLGCQFMQACEHSGWGRSWDGMEIDVYLWWVVINVWARWNITVMADGPMDVADCDKRPLDISNARRLA